MSQRTYSSPCITDSHSRPPSDALESVESVEAQEALLLQEASCGVMMLVVWTRTFQWGHGAIHV